MRSMIQPIDASGYVCCVLVKLTAFETVHKMETIPNRIRACKRPLTSNLY